MTDRRARTTPHRAPLLAAHARSAQLRQRIGEIDARSVGRIVEPLSFDGAIAEEQRLLREGAPSTRTLAIDAPSSFTSHANPLVG